jgi:hypothetical protein
MLAKHVKTVICSDTYFAVNTLVSSDPSYSALGVTNIRNGSKVNAGQELS